MDSIAYGYVFICIYNFICSKDNNVNQKYKIITSIVLNYFLVQIYHCIPHLPKDNFLIYIVVSVVLSYIIGRIVVSKVWEVILLRIGIHRTVNENVWADIFKEEGCGVLISQKDSNIKYYGSMRFYETHNNQPVVALSNYQVFRVNDLENPIEDHSDNSNAMVSLKVNADTIVQIYSTQKKQPKGWSDQDEKK